MSRSVDETRREFLLKLARSAVFVPPAMATFGVGRLAAQGKTSDPTTSDGGKGQGNTTGSTTIGSLSPTAQTIDNPTFQLNRTQQDATSPWAPGSPGSPPPWATPPPTQTGR